MSSDRQHVLRVGSYTRALLVFVALCSSVLGFALVGSSSAAAEGLKASWWHLTAGSQPTNIAPGGEGTIVVTATNFGDQEVSGASSPLTITDRLPAGLEATAIHGWPLQLGYAYEEQMTCPELSKLSCTFAGVIRPYEQLEVRITVKDTGPVMAENEAKVSGGEIASVTASHAVTISASPASFGVEHYELRPESEDGAPETQAGAHPFQLTADFGLTQNTQPTVECQPYKAYNKDYLEKGDYIRKELNPCVAPDALPKDLNFDLPAGLVGNATAVPQCTEEQFDTRITGGLNECPADTAVGVANVLLDVENINLKTVISPIFNLVPSPGEPAKFGFAAEDAPVTLDTSVRTGKDYGVVVTSHNISELPDFLGAQTTFWGVPGDPRHNSSRGWGCVGGELYAIEYERACEHPESQLHPPAFLTLPTSCSGPMQTGIEADTWQEPHTLLPFAATAAMPSLDGCGNVPFSAGIEAAPDLQQGSTGTGLKVNVHVPQSASLDANGIGGADVKEIKVTLPEGVALNPSGADGLEACGESQIGYQPGESDTATGDLHFTSSLPEPLSPGLGLGAEGFCPSAAKIGTVDITTPLLPAKQHLEGAVYLAAQDENPFGSLVAIYIVAEDPVSGVLVKLPGEVSLDGTTGQIEATIRDSPQLPFENAELHFFGGTGAPLSTPSHCGTYTTQASFTPWSGGAAVDSSSSFEITSGPNGSGCPGSVLPFAPSLAAGSTSNQAGAFSALTTTITREDGQQNIQSVQLKMPAGLSGILSGVKLCGEAEANAGSCGAGSLIGSTIVSVGLGSNPYSVTGGKVYLTGPYEGAPFGLSIVNPANAGPFHLGNVVVRARVEVDPYTAALTITTNTPGEGYAIPHILDGIPLEIKHVNVTVERPGFTFNPTNCSPTAITGSVGSDEGASSAVSVPFQVTNCAALKFAPKFSVSTPGHTSKADGAGLTAKLSYPAGVEGTQTNISKVKVDLPKQLPSRLTTLQKACTAKQFEANPADCPKASKIGFATVHTPLLPVPLTGPAIFVSHGGEAFPSLTMVLQGYGVTVDLVGTTYISHAGITSTTFKTVPDVPFSTFELTLGQGLYSALAANLPVKDKGSFCGQTLSMPTAFVAQNGTEIHESTKMSVSGCAKKKATKKKKSKKKASKKK
jgi:hypothetical protein